MNLVALVRVLRDIYQHPFITEVTAYATEIGLTIREFDLSIVDNVENFALTLLEDKSYSSWMPILGSFGVEKKLERPGWLDYGVVDGFVFLTLCESEKGFAIKLRKWEGISESLSRLNVLAEAKE